ncbi:MAG: polyprenyl synthetase family protein [Desulfobacteraceae bacterium]|jgi:geranylgeranyl diphosphate synthase type II
MFQLRPYLDTLRARIDIELEQQIRRLCPSEHMQAPCLYSMLAGGKRLRPILCLAASDAVGGDIETVMPAACAIEMIHTYSLIHDDLPALDNDTVRRGQPTCHIKFDESTAILCGDALLTMSFEMLSEAGMQQDVSKTHLWLRCIQIISNAAGCSGMVEGQARDLAFEGISLDTDALKQLHSLKTGALIRAAVESGGCLGGGSNHQIAQLVSYAVDIGLAFQVVDDILNVTGDPETMGKAVGTDQALGKNTYPALLGLEASRCYANDLVNRALKALSIFDKKAEPLRAIAQYVVDRER